MGTHEIAKQLSMEHEIKPSLRAYPGSVTLPAFYCDELNEPFPAANIRNRSSRDNHTQKMVISLINQICDPSPASRPEHACTSLWQFRCSGKAVSAEQAILNEIQQKWDESCLKYIVGALQAD